MSTDNMTLEQHAIAWYAEQGKTMHPTSTPEGIKEYQAWATWAFSGVN